MKSVFIDTNVIIDFLADRVPFSEDAAKLFELAKNKHIEIYIAAISINNTYYILRQVTSHQKALKLIDQIENYVTIIATSQKIIQQAIKSNFNDFEDAIQYYSAKDNAKIEVIITRNTKDFKTSDIPILTPETSVKLIIDSLNL